MSASEAADIRCSRVAPSSRAARVAFILRLAATLFTEVCIIWSGPHHWDTMCSSGSEQILRWAVLWSCLCSGTGSTQILFHSSCPIKAPVFAGVPANWATQRIWRCYHSRVLLYPSAALHVSLRSTVDERKPQTAMFCSCRRGRQGEPTEVGSVMHKNLLIQENFATSRWSNYRYDCLAKQRKYRDCLLMLDLLMEPTASVRTASMSCPANYTSSCSWFSWWPPNHWGGPDTAE